MQLKGRDRQLLVLAAVLVVAWMGWMLWVGPSLERNAQAREQIVRKEKQLKQLMGLRAQWDSLQARQAAFEARLERRGKNFSLAAAVQGAASRAGVASCVKATKEEPAVAEGPYRRRAVEVELEGLTLDQLVSYLYQVEGPADMLHVKRLEVRPKADNPMYLDVSVAVSSVERAAGG